MGLQEIPAYLDSLRDGRRVYYRGELVDDVAQHPVLGRAISHAAVDFEMAHDPAHRPLAVVEGPEPYSRYYLVPQSAEDLKQRSRLIAEGTRLGGTVVPLIHEIGSDALFGLLHVAHRVDEECISQYLPRVQRFLDEARHHDWALAVAQTDAKGDRSKGPSGQPNPNAYLRIVEERADGIVVRGVKVHTSVSINANRLIVLPTRAMKEEDRAYAVAFATPLNAPGLTLVASPYLGETHNAWERPLSSRHKMVETITWFDDVFIPNDQVFLKGEWEFAGLLAKTFVDFHRFTAVSYKLPLLTAMVGVASLLAKYNGISRAPHVREALTQLMMYEATVRTLLEASTDKGMRITPGVFRPDPATINLAKYHFATGIHQAFLAVQDIAGGLLVTGPGEEDWQHPEIGPMLDQYLAGAEGTGSARMRLINLATDLVASDLGAYHLVLAVHAEGSIVAEKLGFVQAYGIADAEAEAARLAGLHYPET
jgi:4-hydroxybutyryl-CoA dehydratase / vinylacetyl-CoA-Delta-isomerase